MPILSELHAAINRTFSDAGIVISFPQRDIHFDTDKPLRITYGSTPVARRLTVSALEPPALRSIL
ncbi:MAG: hypothetical protein WBM97_08380 [Sedimenticolaceae bacterium]